MCRRNAARGAAAPCIAPPRSGQRSGLAATLVLLLAALGPQPAPAQFAAEPGQFHWAYAAGFGTGLYRLSDFSDVLVVRLPLQWRWREPDPNTGCCGVLILLPVTLGFEDFSFDEAFEGERPERIEQVSFLPGVELEYPRTERWTLKTRAQLGWGTQTSADRESALVYGVGARSRYEWPQAAGRPALVNGLQWIGFDVRENGRDSMIRVSNGMEFAIPVPRWRFRDQPMQLMPHVLTDWYLDTLEVPDALDGSADNVHVEWEIGLAAGREEPFSILGFEFDRVGVAYRFSDQTEGIRLFVSSIF